MAEISIRAPARGATIRGDINADDRLYFNPRSREGSDEHCRQASGHQFISIRAPARGATVSLVTRDSAHKHFNPRSREGSDVLSA